LSRYGSVGITLIQAIGFAINLMATSAGAIIVGNVTFVITFMIVLTAGTAFVMWLGERITDRGIGNGISILIMIGIIARLPTSLINACTTSSTSIILNVHIE